MPGKPWIPRFLKDLIGDATHRTVSDAQIAVWDAAAPFISFAAEVAVNGATALDATAFGKSHVCAGVAADYAVSLPAAAGNAGKVIGFRMVAGLTKLVTLDAGAGSLIDGIQTRIMWTNETALLLCDGTNWVKIAGKSIPMTVTVSSSVVTALGGQGAYTDIPMDTLVDGVAAMLSGGGIKLLRPGIYAFRGEASTATAATATTVGRIKNMTTTEVYGSSSTTASYPTAIPHTFGVGAKDNIVKLQAYCFTSSLNNYAGDRLKVREEITW